LEKLAMIWQSYALSFLKVILRNVAEAEVTEAFLGKDVMAY
jgi:hypothetical protein